MSWEIFTGKRKPHNGIERLPPPPKWREFGGEIAIERRLPGKDDDAMYEDTKRGKTFQVSPDIVRIVNAALYLRRPILITGKPGSGKSSLIYAVAYELRLGNVLQWAITSRSTLRDALYQYDAIGRLQETQFQGRAPGIEKYLKLGPLGTALLPTGRPRALLIDEIDKSDIDLPNDLLNVFEEGRFDIPELERYSEETVHIQAYKEDERFPIHKGRVVCREFPFVVLTSNGEREFPSAFLRRCLRLEMPEPDRELLGRIVSAHLGAKAAAEADEIIEEFLERRSSGALATDQLLNAIHMLMQKRDGISANRDVFVDLLLKELSTL
ncbi:MAG TPA: MoxR family ATPase [Blastocatellia bacterium]|nr:MoxR family ATPase [Blastocatellia bacterium]